MFFKAQEEDAFKDKISSPIPVVGLAIPPLAVNLNECLPKSVKASCQSETEVLKSSNAGRY
ncbi:MAG: hypothetical protein LBV23_00135 [Deltaproteobacteria bacterium]|jgi:hypothetical protein|nr:hypothetical protein [Deltaproteobacteria bacterium]